MNFGQKRVPGGMAIAVPPGTFFLGCLIALLTLIACPPQNHRPDPIPNNPFLLILGVAQDAGYPQAGCAKTCCQPAWENPTLSQFPTCLGIVDPQTRQYWLIEATPDFKWQMNILQKMAGFPPDQLPDGIFLTHAHIGHYTGLIHLGREVIGAKQIPVHVLPRMHDFLQKNGPWNQLTSLENIKLMPLVPNRPVQLTEKISIRPFLVPHRDEFSETAGFMIRGPDRSLIFIPDIDKWGKWDQDIQALVRENDFAFLDGTFFDATELPGRDMSEIPHPFIKESMEQFKNLSSSEKEKIFFIHLNHSNPALQPDSKTADVILQQGFRISSQGAVFPL
jgi:pyrroloquinoline quinone biosynthesis protein B